MTATAEPALGQGAVGAVRTVLAEPLVSFGPEIAADPGAALRREWLVTNGLGGYASGSVAGVNTRRYHGLLVAALDPPVERTVLVAGSIDWVTYDGHRYPLATHEYGDGTIDPQGYRYLRGFELEGSLPVWTFAVGDALVEKRVWMAHESNTTYVTYRVLRGSLPLDLEISPLVTYHDFHLLSHGGWPLSVAEVPDGIEVRACDGAAPFAVRAPGAQYAATNAWYWNVLHRQETARGLDDRSDLYLPGVFSRRMRSGETFTLVQREIAEDARMVRPRPEVIREVLAAAPDSSGRDIKLA